ncbi:MAG: Hsp70 family protein [Planctomycetales bacterium]|nr:Hsp70 family protein [Planctomycetales bacterium]
MTSDYATSNRTDGFEARPSRYIVGIDLGTTNCAVAYIDSEQAPLELRTFPILQFVDLGSQEHLELLPSFYYQPTDAEATASKQSQLVGVLARQRGQQMPGRQIASAKSWLCHSGVDRSSAILPWQADEGVRKLSPVEASATYLAHIANCWNVDHPNYPLAEQDIVLTLPASFDQVARQLTIDAASKAGLPRILPIEEPQAAFYAWLARHANDWDQLVSSGQTILVCDIGGGTTDFTLIRVRDHHLQQEIEAQLQDGKTPNRLALHRVAVGQHLILGGDNLDLALAAIAEKQLGGRKLSSRAWDSLRQVCRDAKEQILGDLASTDELILHLPGSGARLIGSGEQLRLNVDQVTTSLLDGFFPLCNLSDRPVLQNTGFQEFGLPFATDPAITKHLATFLWDHRHAGRTDLEIATLPELLAAKPDHVLFNGGVLTSQKVKGRIIEALSSWFSHADGRATVPWQPSVLESTRLDLAVAHGAAYFGSVRRGQGVSIEANLACSYYLQTKYDPPQAVCLVPGSAKAGEAFRLEDLPFDLTVGEPVEFPILYSSSRLSDRLGEQVVIDDENFARLPPIRTVLTFAKKRGNSTIPVFVGAELSEIGTIDMWCQTTDGLHRWQLEFDVRNSIRTEHVSACLDANSKGILDDSVLKTAQCVIEEAFSERPTLKPAQVIHRLSAELELSRGQWTPALLRGMWKVLMDHSEGRRHSPAHEARWLNLLGYCLRPGYGMAADDWRVAHVWRSIFGKLAYAESKNESLILWRRLAGGFTAGQQQTVYEQVASPLRATLDPDRRAKGGALAANELVELLRLVGSLELLPQVEKQQLARWLLPLVANRKYETSRAAVLWTLSRLGTRVPMYGPLNCVVDSEEVSNWIAVLLRKPVMDPAYNLALMMCSRRVQDRYRDIDEPLRTRVLDQLISLRAPSKYTHLVEVGGNLDQESASEVAGEKLPLGLRLRVT